MKKLKTAFLAIFVATFMGLTGNIGVAHAQDSPALCISPDGCFVFDGGIQTIVAYGDTAIKAFESNPELVATISTNCPKDVVIPDTLAGAIVLHIADGAFANPSDDSSSTPSDGLSSVILPSGLQTIGESSFADNTITSVTIPSSLNSMGSFAFGINRIQNVTFEPGSSLQSLSEGAFAFNRIAQITIPNSVVSINPTTFYGQSEDSRNAYISVTQGSVSSYEQVISETWFVQVATENPANPNNLKNATNIVQEYGTDLNGNRTTNDNVSLGGHLINTSSATLNYLSEADQALLQSVTFTGKVNDGTQLTNYLANDWQTWPTIADEWNVTPQEQAEIDAILAAYWVQGQTVTFTAPDIAGYITPSPATRSAVLSASTNAMNFVYAQPAAGVASAGQLAETGASTWALGLLSISMVALSYIALKNRSRKVSFR